MDNLKNTIIATYIAIALLLSCKSTHIENDWEYLDVAIMTNDYKDADVINTDTVPDPIPEEPEIPEEEPEEEPEPDTLGVYLITQY